MQFLKTLLFFLKTINIKRYSTNKSYPKFMVYPCVNFTKFGFKSSFCVEDILLKKLKL